MENYGVGVGLSELLRSVLKLKSEGAKEAPATPEGVFLALALYLRPESLQASLPDKMSLFASVQISSRLGMRAYQDLVRCQWIQGQRFNPKISKGTSVSQHIGVVRSLLDGSPGQFQGWAAQNLPQGLSVKNRLLLVILLVQASPAGRVGPISFGTLSNLTGFTRGQVRVQLQKLKELGVVSGVVPGVTGAALFGVSESYIYLNILHPCWGDSFTGWRAVCLDASLWPDVLDEESKRIRLLDASSHDELVRRPELRRYFRNLMLILISSVLSQHWISLRTGGWEDVLRMRLALPGRRLRNELPASFDSLFPGFADIATRLQSELCKGDVGLSEKIGLGDSKAWSFCVLPQFDDRLRPLVVLTDCPYLSSEIDVNWLRTSAHNLWVAKGLVTSPNAAPLKLRSRKPKLL